MFQQITPVIPTGQRGFKSLKLKALVHFSLLVGAMLWLVGLQANPTFSHPPLPEAGTGMLFDTIVEASICEGETYVFDGELLNMAGEYVATFVAEDGSDSTVTLQLSVLPRAFTELEASICTGETYPFNGEELDQEGIYTAIYVAENGCDSIVSLELSVLPVPNTDLEVSICEGETYEFDGQLLDQAGSYTATYLAENGCDSIVSLKLQVLAPINTSLSAGICEGTEYLFQGETLTESGVYSAVLKAESGCDSIVTLTLDVVPFFETPVSAAICPGGTYEFGGQILTDPGVYTELLTAIGGCDSTIILTLSFLPTTSSDISASICTGASYDFYGEILTASGSYEALFTGENGCDSTVVLKLEVVDFYETALEVSICAGDALEYNGEILTDAGEYTFEFIAEGGCDSTVTLTLVVLPLSTGAAQATICAEGSYEYNGEVLTDAGDYTFVLTGENGCDSTVVLTLNVLPANETAIEAAICAGETYPFAGEVLTMTGIYEAILTAYNGCDSVVTLTLTVRPTSDSTLNVAICTGESYDYNGEILTDAGEYQFVLEAYNGCDSTVTLVLSVNEPQDTTVTVNICEGDAYEFDGTLISDAGTYIATFVGDNGCDSTVTLELGLLPLQNTAIEVTICDNETYPFDGQNLDAEGTYTGVFTGENGCDSTVVLTLLVLPTQSTLITATICDGDALDYFGTSLTTAGDFDFVFDAFNGCDSTVTVRITVLPVPTTNIEASICDGESYDYNGELLSVSGDYEFVFVAYNGCDSIVTVQLEVLPLLSSNLAVSLCEGGSYEFNGDILTVSGTYVYTFTGENGCDSTVTLVLEFVGSFETNLTVSICAGESYVFGNDTLTESGDYSQLLIAEGNCDSLVTLALTVLPLTESTTDVSICAGETYNFNGLDLTDSGTYSAVLTDENGCDSTAILNLTVLPANTTALEATICANETYTFNGLDLSDAGVYSIVLAAENGCDSTVVLTLEVLPTQSSSITATICANETYPFNGLDLSDAGVYSIVLVAENGCDSTVVLTLEVLPTQSSSIAATICANETYDFDGQSLSVEGSYTATLQAENGCDSILTLQLTVLPLAENAFAVSVCDGGTFEFNGEVLSQSGVYEAIYAGAALNGCDSIETLFLTILPAIAPTNISASICAGDSYDFYGISLTAAGTYTNSLSSVLGCDSNIVLTLTVNASPTTNLNESICAGESYSFNGLELTASGVYTAVFQTGAGCDSTVVLTLVVNSVNTGVSLQNNTLTAAAVNASYQWIDCATNLPIEDATDATFTPPTTGNYAVVVTQNGCTATSTCVFVQVVSTQEPLGGAAWTLQPNPATEFTQVVFSVAVDEDLWIEVLDMAGRSLLREKVSVGAYQIDLNLNMMPEGILIVRLANERGVSTKRLMKG
jgi:hypothetical protein